jgi:hypothetical protein
MLGLNVKRGVATTLERVFHNSTFKFGSLNVLWTGQTAGIQFNRYGDDHLDATVIFPSVDESAEIPQTTFNNLIGYALHELGHAWFTTNKPWDLARKRYGAFVGNLINGLEDPRIEKLVIESGHAPNARALFGNLINSVLDRDGYVDPNDAKNIPFVLAVEGRRLNGYVIDVPNIIDDSIYAKHIHWALGRANKASDTSEIVKIAVELFKRIKQQDEDAGQGEGDQEGQPSGDDGQPDNSIQHLSKTVTRVSKAIRLVTRVVIRLVIRTAIKMVTKVMSKAMSQAKILSVVVASRMMVVVRLSQMILFVTS